MGIFHSESREFWEILGEIWEKRDFEILSQGAARPEEAQSFEPRGLTPSPWPLRERAGAPPHWSLITAFACWARFDTHSRFFCVSLFLICAAFSTKQICPNNSAHKNCECASKVAAQANAAIKLQSGQAPVRLPGSRGGQPLGSKLSKSLPTL